MEINENQNDMEVFEENAEDFYEWILIPITYSEEKKMELLSRVKQMITLKLTKGFLI